MTKRNIFMIVLGGSGTFAVKIYKNPPANLRDLKDSRAAERFFAPQKLPFAVESVSVWENGMQTDEVCVQ